MNRVQGKVALSNYESAFLDKLYPAPKWRKITQPPRTNHATKGKRVEVLWTNYDPQQPQEEKNVERKATKKPAGLFE